MISGSTKIHLCDFRLPLHFVVNMSDAGKRNLHTVMKIANRLSCSQPFVLNSLTLPRHMTNTCPNVDAFMNAHLHMEFTFEMNYDYLKKIKGITFIWVICLQPIPPFFESGNKTGIFECKHSKMMGVFFKRLDQHLWFL